MMNDEGTKPIIEESYAGERGGFGGKIISSLKGKMKKKIVLPLCYVCGRKLAEQIIVCEDCENACCQSCIITYNGASKCLKCLEAKFSKRNFKVLLCIPLSKRKIQEVTKIPLEEIELSLMELQIERLIVKKGLILKCFEYTDKGKEILHLYSKVYTGDDILEINNQLRKLSRRDF